MMSARLRAACALCLLAACGDDADPGPSHSNHRDAAPARGDEGDAAHGSAVPPEVSAHVRDWPLPNRDYDNTRATFSAKIDASNVTSLHERWRMAFDPASGEPFGTLTASPLVLGDTIYLQDMMSNVFAIATGDGTLRWSAKLDLPTIGPNGVAIGWGKVFADLGDRGLIAFDLEKHTELWRFEPHLATGEGVDIQPIAYGGMVFTSTVPASLRGAYLGNGRGILYALDHAHGAAAWLFDTVDSADLWGDADTNCGGGAWYPPLVDAKRDRVYFGTGNPGPFPGTTASPSGSSRPGPNLYTSSVVALDRERGTLDWYHQERAHDLFDWDFQNSPLRIEIEIDGSARELVIGSGKTGTVVALDPSTGELAWRAKVGLHENDELDAIPEGDAVRVLPGALGGVLTAPAYADGVVFAPVVDMATSYSGDTYSPELSSGTGELVAIDARDGTVLWHKDLPAPCYGAATVVNDLILTSDGNGRVYAFDRASGDQVWTYDAPAGINAPISVAGDLLLVPVGVSSEPVLIALSL